MTDKTQRFIDRARLIHSNKYDYTKTVYVHSMQKVTITCPIHGDFQVTPNAHISTQRSGCQKCAGRYRYNTEEFITEAGKLHNDWYNYDAVVYVNNKTKVSISCPTHGEFSVTPRDHIHNRSGCPRCGNASKGQYHRKDTNWFVSTAIAIHGNKYDYSNVKYQRYHDKVEIVCPEHGPFFQTAGSHIHNKNGCPACSVKDYEGGYGKRRFDTHPEIKNNPAILYVIKVHNDAEQFIKVGITQKSVRDRFEINNRLPYKYEIVGTISGRLYELFLVEQSTKKQLKQFKYKPLIKFNGHTECFIEEAQHDLLDLVGINTTLETIK